MAVACPHCGAENPAGGSFCERCGKALPAAIASQPRFVEGADLAATQTGRSLQAEQLRVQSRKASGALLAVAILQTLGAIVITALVRSGRPAPGLEAAEDADATVLGVVLFGLAGVYWALWWWSRRNPLPAAIVGLVIFLTVWFIDAMFDPGQILRGILIRIIIVAVLIKAIQAGAQHRRLLRGAADDHP